ncbi:hypothetical protein BaRGS_00011311, partial [Batillaria attramentaria]
RRAVVRSKPGLVPKPGGRPLAPALKINKHRRVFNVRSAAATASEGVNEQPSTSATSFGARRGRRPNVVSPGTRRRGRLPAKRKASTSESQDDNSGVLDKKNTQKSTLQVKPSATDTPVSDVSKKPTSNEKVPRALKRLKIDLVESQVSPDVEQSPASRGKRAVQTSGPATPTEQAGAATPLTFKQPGETPARGRGKRAVAKAEDKQPILADQPGSVDGKPIDRRTKAWRDYKSRLAQQASEAGTVPQPQTTDTSGVPVPNLATIDRRTKAWRDYKSKLAQQVSEGEAISQPQTAETSDVDSQATPPVKTKGRRNSKTVLEPPLMSEESCSSEILSTPEGSSSRHSAPEGVPRGRSFVKSSGRRSFKGRTSSTDSAVKMEMSAQTRSLTPPSLGGPRGRMSLSNSNLIQKLSLLTNDLRHPRTTGEQYVSNSRNSSPGASGSSIRRKSQQNLQVKLLRSSSLDDLVQSNDSQPLSNSGQFKLFATRSRESSPADRKEEQALEDQQTGSGDGVRGTDTPVGDSKGYFSSKGFYGSGKRKHGGGGDSTSCSRDNSPGSIKRKRMLQRLRDSSTKEIPDVLPPLSRASRSLLPTNSPASSRDSSPGTLPKAKGKIRSVKVDEDVSMEIDEKMVNVQDTQDPLQKAKIVAHDLPADGVKTGSVKNVSSLTAVKKTALTHHRFGQQRGRKPGRIPSLHRKPIPVRRKDISLQPNKQAAEEPDGMKPEATEDSEDVNKLTAPLLPSTSTMKTVTDKSASVQEDSLSQSPQNTFSPLSISIPSAKGTEPKFLTEKTRIYYQQTSPSEFTAMLVGPDGKPVTLSPSSVSNKTEKQEKLIKTTTVNKETKLEKIAGLTHAPVEQEQKPAQNIVAASPQPSVSTDLTQVSSVSDAQPQLLIKRGPGRPRKIRSPEAEVKVKRKPGRPKKVGDPSVAGHLTASKPGMNVPLVPGVAMKRKPGRPKRQPMQSPIKCKPGRKNRGLLTHSAAAIKSIKRKPGRPKKNSQPVPQSAENPTASDLSGRTRTDNALTVQVVGLRSEQSFDSAEMPSPGSDLHSHTDYSKQASSSHLQSLETQQSTDELPQNMQPGPSENIGRTKSVSKKFSLARTVGKLGPPTAFEKLRRIRRMKRRKARKSRWASGRLPKQSLKALNKLPRTESPEGVDGASTSEICVQPEDITPEEDTKAAEDITPKRDDDKAAEDITPEEDARAAEVSTPVDNTKAESSNLPAGDIEQSQSTQGTVQVARKVKRNMGSIPRELKRLVIDDGRSGMGGRLAKKKLKDLNRRGLLLRSRVKPTDGKSSTPDPGARNSKVAGRLKHKKSSKMYSVDPVSETKLIFKSGSKSNAPKLDQETDTLGSAGDGSSVDGSGSHFTQNLGGIKLLTLGESSTSTLVLDQQNTTSEQVGRLPGPLTVAHVHRESTPDRGGRGLDGDDSLTVDIEDGQPPDITETEFSTVSPSEGLSPPPLIRPEDLFSGEYFASVTKSPSLKAEVTSGKPTTSSKPVEEAFSVGSSDGQKVKSSVHGQSDYTSTERLGINTPQEPSFPAQYNYVYSADDFEARPKRRPGRPPKSGRGRRMGPASKTGRAPNIKPGPASSKPGRKPKTLKQDSAVSLVKTLSEPRRFALRPKSTRSPIEIIAMRQKQEEEEYDLEEATKLARRLKRRRAHVERLLASASDETRETHESCKPCSVVLVDFVKKLQLDALDSSDQYVSDVSYDTRQGVSVKGMHGSVKQQTVKVPSTSPRASLSEEPAAEPTLHPEVKKTTPDLESLRGKGFVGNFVDFLENREKKPPKPVFYRNRWSQQQVASASQASGATAPAPSSIMGKECEQQGTPNLVPELPVDTASQELGSSTGASNDAAASVSVHSSSKTKEEMENQPSDETRLTEHPSGTVNQHLGSFTSVSGAAPVSAHSNNTREQSETQDSPVTKSPEGSAAKSSQGLSTSRQDDTKTAAAAEPFPAWGSPGKLKIFPIADKSVAARYLCKKCDFSSGVKQTMESHVYRHIPGVTFKCGYCSSEFSAMASVQAHVKNGHPGKETRVWISKDINEAGLYSAEELPAGVSSPPAQQTSADLPDPAAIASQICETPAIQESQPLIISLVVRSDLRPDRYNDNRAVTPARRFVCTHCGYSTNRNEDAKQHTKDLHKESLYSCYLCDKAFGSSLDDIQLHCTTVHPNRPNSYKKLPDFYDQEHIRGNGTPDRPKPEDRGNIFDRMSSLFQAPSPGSEGGEDAQVSPRLHLERARAYMHIIEGMTQKTMVEADSTTVGDIEIPPDETLEATTSNVDSTVEEQSLDEPAVSDDPSRGPGEGDRETRLSEDEPSSSYESSKLFESCNKTPDTPSDMEVVSSVVADVEATSCDKDIPTDDQENTISPAAKDDVAAAESIDPEKSSTSLTETAGSSSQTGLNSDTMVQNTKSDGQDINTDSNGAEMTSAPVDGLARSDSSIERASTAERSKHPGSADGSGDVPVVGEKDSSAEMSAELPLGKDLDTGDKPCRVEDAESDSPPSASEVPVMNSAHATEKSTELEKDLQTSDNSVKGTEGETASDRSSNTENTTDDSDGGSGMKKVMDVPAVDAGASGDATSRSSAAAETHQEGPADAAVNDGSPTLTEDDSVEEPMAVETPEAEKTNVSGVEDDNDMGLKIAEVVSLRDKMDYHGIRPSPAKSPTQSERGSREPSPSKKATTPVSSIGGSDTDTTPSSKKTSPEPVSLPEVDADDIAARNERLVCTYKCHRCNVHSPALSAIVEHLKQYHRDVSLFSCPYCKSKRGSFFTEEEVHTHVKDKHPTNYAKNEVSLSEVAKSFVQVLAIPSGRNSGGGLTEQDVYMCLKCENHVPDLDYAFKHLQLEHPGLIKYACPTCKTFRDGSQDVVQKHMLTEHLQTADCRQLSLAIEDNFFTRVTSISLGGVYCDHAPVTPSKAKRTPSHSPAASSSKGGSPAVTAVSSSPASKMTNTTSITVQTTASGVIPVQAVPAAGDNTSLIASSAAPIAQIGLMQLGSQLFLPAPIGIPVNVTPQSGPLGIPVNIGPHAAPTGVPVAALSSSQSGLRKSSANTASPLAVSASAGTLLASSVACQLPSSVLAQLPAGSGIATNLRPILPNTVRTDFEATGSVNAADILGTSPTKKWSSGMTVKEILDRCRKNGDASTATVASSQASQASNQSLGPQQSSDTSAEPEDQTAKATTPLSVATSLPSASGDQSAVSDISPRRMFPMTDRLDRLGHGRSERSHRSVSPSTATAVAPTTTSPTMGSRPVLNVPVPSARGIVSGRTALHSMDTGTAVSTLPAETSRPVVSAQARTSSRSQTDVISGRLPLPQANSGTSPAPKGTSSAPIDVEDPDAYKIFNLKPRTSPVKQPSSASPVVGQKSSTPVPPMSPNAPSHMLPPTSVGPAAVPMASSALFPQQFRLQQFPQVQQGLDIAALSQALNIGMSQSQQLLMAGQNQVPMFVPANLAFMPQMQAIAGLGQAPVAHQQQSTAPPQISANLAVAQQTGQQQVIAAQQAVARLVSQCGNTPTALSTASSSSAAFQQRVSGSRGRGRPRLPRSPVQRQGSPQQALPQQPQPAPAPTQTPPQRPPVLPPPPQQQQQRYRSPSPAAAPRGPRQTTSHMCVCPYCPRPLILKPWEVSSHIRLQHPGEKVVYNRV